MGIGPSGFAANSAAATPLCRRLMVPEERKDKNDRKRNSEQPKECTSTETHVNLHVLMTAPITRLQDKCSQNATPQASSIPLSDTQQLRGEKAEGDLLR